MTTKIVMSIYFDADESNQLEISALLAKLLGSPNPVSTTVEMAGSMVKAAKVRKTRVMTDEQKAAFRARMIAGREAKAAAEIKSVEPVKSDVNPVEPAMVESRTNAKSKPAKPDATKPSPKASTMPRNGHKVAAKPASL